MFKFKKTLAISLFIVMIISNAFAYEYVVCDFEDSTIYNFQTRWTADGVRWVPDPTGRSVGVMELSINSGYQQPDFTQKGYMYLQNQYLMDADSLKMDIWVPSEFPASLTNPWFVLYILYGGQWMQHSAEGVYEAEGPTGGSGWPAKETWFTLTMSIEAAVAEGPGNVGEIELKRCFNHVGLFQDWLGTDWSGIIYIDNVRFTGVEHPLLATKPNHPTEITVIDSIEGENTVEWIDETLIPAETYSIYISVDPITDITAASVQKVAAGIAAGRESWTHRLFSTGESETVSYYYAVNSENWFGNGYTTPIAGQNSTTEPVTNTTHSINPIYYINDITFTIDGSLDEFSDYIPFHLDAENSRHTGSYTGEDDYSADIWVVLTDSDLIIAADIKDDEFDEGNQWSPYEITGDVFEIYLGFYEYLTTPARNYMGSDAYRISYAALPHPVNGWQVFQPFFHIRTGESIKVNTSGGWILEFRIPYDDFNIDFTPQVGMTLPIDFNLRDTDSGDMTISDFGGRRNESGGTGLWFAPCQWAHTEIWDTTLVLDVVDDPEYADEFKINRAYPNPFNSFVTASFVLPALSDVDLSIYDITGRKIKTIVKGYRNAGIYNITWNGTNSVGRTVSSGIYFVCLKTTYGVNIQKISYLK